MIKLIFIFGDSTAWGAWDKEKGGWVNRLKTYFFKDESIFVYGLGIESNTTNDLLKRFDEEINQRIYAEDAADYGYDPVVIFAIGKNDTIYIDSKKNTWVKIDKFENNLKKLIKRANKFTNKIIFISPARVDEEETIFWEETGESYCNENIEKYNSVIEKVCQKNNVHFIETMNLLDQKDLADGLHPNSQGHEKIFQKVKKFLLENKLIGK